MMKLQPTDYKRIIGKITANLTANIYLQSVNVLIQLAAIPLYLHYWGTELYGEWLLLSAVPAYLNLSDFGIATVAANRMSMMEAMGQRDEVSKIYRSCWTLHAITLPPIFIVLLAITSSLDITSLLSLTHLTDREAFIIVILLSLYALNCLLCNVVMAAYRVAARNSQGITLTATIRASEWLIATGLLIIGGSPILIASTMFITRLIGFTLLVLHVKTFAPTLSVSVSHEDVGAIKSMLRPAVAFLAFPAGLAMNIQGVILIVGVLLGPTSVVIFSTYRTLSRVLVQALTMISQSAWPEMTTAYAANNFGALRAIHVKLYQIAGLGCVIAAGTIYSFGDVLLSVWTRGNIGLDENLLIGVLAVAIINVIWQPSWVLLMSTNMHVRFGLCYILSSGLAVLATIPSMNIWGLHAVPVVLFIFDIPLLIMSLALALRLTGQHWRRFLRALLLHKSPEKIG